MSVVSKILLIINHNNFFAYLLGLTLSTVLVGYAPSSIFLGIFVFFTIRHRILNKLKFRISKLLFLPLGFYLICCLSFFWTVDYEQTLKGIGRLSVFLILPICLSSIPKLNNKSLQIIFNCFTVSNLLLGFFFLLVAAINYYKERTLMVFTYHDLVSILDLNAIYVSVFFTISYFYIQSKLDKSQSDYLKLIFLGLLVILLSSKAVIFTLILGNIIYVIVRGRKLNLKKSKILVVGVVITFFLAFVSRGIFERVLVETKTNLEEVIYKEKFNRVYPWTGTSIRILQLRNLKGQIEEDNIFWSGFGLYASRENLKKRHLAFNTYYGYHDYNYHNMYAQALSELGIFGLIILVSMLGFGIRKAIKIKSFFMFMFFFIMAVVFFTESFLWVHRGVFLFVILITIFFRSDISSLGLKDI